MQHSRNGKCPQLLLAATTLLLASGVAGAANAACALTYGALTSTLPNLGNVVSATVGETVFRVAPQTGAITIPSGNGGRTSSGDSIVSMTISTANHAHCQDVIIDGTVTATGSTNRAKNMRNFNISVAGNITLNSQSGTGATRTFQLKMPKDKSGTLYVGMDFPIKGDNEGGATGLATSSYTISLNAVNGNDISRSGQGRATVRRSLRMVKTSDLSFGKIVRPSTGSSLVVLNSFNGARTLSGSGVGIETPAPSRAAYTITGEAAQIVSITVPPSVSMTGPGPALTVNLTAFRPPPQNELEDQGDGTGSYTFYVGGSFTATSTTPTGTYSGVFNVSVSYN